MSEFSGLDPDAISRLAQKVGVQAGQMHGVMMSVNALVAEVKRSWHGPHVTEFEAKWNRELRPQVIKAHKDLQQLHDWAKSNAARQAEASKSLEVPNFARYTSSFGTKVKGGYVFSVTTTSNVTQTVNSDGTISVSASSAESVDLSLSELVTVLAAPEAAVAKAAEDEAKVAASFDASIGSEKTVTVTYDNPDNPTKVYDTYSDGISGGTKPLTGYSQDDLWTDTAKTGETPSSVTTTSAEIHGSLSIGVSDGVHGGSIGVQAAASTYTTAYQDGTVGSGLTFQASADVTGKLDMGPLEAHATGSALASGQVEIIRDAQGHPLSVTVSYSGTTSVETGVGSLGHEHSDTVAQTWVRTETFSYDDPQVRATFGSDPDPISAIATAGKHPDLGTETFTTSKLQSDTDSQNVVVGEFGSTGSQGETTGEWYRDPHTSEWHRQIYH